MKLPHIDTSKLASQLSGYCSAAASLGKDLGKDLFSRLNSAAASREQRTAVIVAAALLALGLAFTLVRCCRSRKAKAEVPVVVEPKTKEQLTQTLSTDPLLSCGTMHVWKLSETRILTGLQQSDGVVYGVLTDLANKIQIFGSFKDDTCCGNFSAMKLDGTLPNLNSIRTIGFEGSPQQQIDGIVSLAIKRFKPRSNGGGAGITGFPFIATHSTPDRRNRVGQQPLTPEQKEVLANIKRGLDQLPTTWKGKDGTSYTSVPPITPRNNRSQLKQDDESPFNRVFLKFVQEQNVGGTD